MNKNKTEQKRNELWGHINDFVEFKTRVLWLRVCLVVLIHWCDV